MFLETPAPDPQHQKCQHWLHNRYCCLACSFVVHSLVFLPVLWLVAGGAGGSGGDGVGYGGGVVGFVHLAETVATADQPAAATAATNTEEVQIQEDTPEANAQTDSASAVPPEQPATQPPLTADAVPIVQKKPEEKPPVKEKTARSAPVTAAPQAQKEKKQPQMPPAASGDKGQNTSDTRGEQAPGSGDGDTAGTGGSGGWAEGTGPPEGEGRGNAPFGFSLAEVDAHPAVLRKTNPVYPESARRKRISGEVVLRFLLEASGSVTHLQVVRSDPRGVFDQASLAAVKQWRFSPAMKDGQAVPAWVEVPLHFSLR